MSLSQDDVKFFAKNYVVLEEVKEKDSDVDSVATVVDVEPKFGDTVPVKGCTCDADSDCSETEHMVEENDAIRDSEFNGLKEEFLTWYQSLKDYNAQWPNVRLKKLYRGCRKIIKVFREESCTSPVDSE